MGAKLGIGSTGKYGSEDIGKGHMEDRWVTREALRDMRRGDGFR